MKRGALVTLIIVMSLALSGCTWMTDLFDSHRIMKQNSLDSSHTSVGYWLYGYDTNNQLTTVRYYNASDALVNTTTYTYSAGERSRADTVYESGSTSGSIVYSYTSAGVLTKAEFYTGDTLTGYNTYEFNDGRKTTTRRYTASGAGNGKAEFAYDAEGARTTTKSYDAGSNLMTTATRTYTDGLVTEIAVLGSSSAYSDYYRTFEWESGTDTTDTNVFFEF
jgi:hypothetical protein